MQQIETQVKTLSPGDAEQLLAHNETRKNL